MVTFWASAFSWALGLDRWADLEVIFPFQNVVYLKDISSNNYLILQINFLLFLGMYYTTSHLATSFFFLCSLSSQHSVLDPFWVFGPIPWLSSLRKLFICGLFLFLLLLLRPLIIGLLHSHLSSLQLIPFSESTPQNQHVK